MTTTSTPTLTERERGGWLALSPADDSLRIAVLGDTAEEAKANYSDALTAWSRLLLLAQQRKRKQQ